MVVRAKTIDSKRNESEAFKFWSALLKLTRTSFTTAGKNCFGHVRRRPACPHETAGGITFLNLWHAVYLD